MLTQICDEFGEDRLKLLQSGRHDGYMDELRMNWIEMQDLGLWEWQLGFRFEHVESWESSIKWGDGG